MAKAALDGSGRHRKLILLIILLIALIASGSLMSGWCVRDLKHLQHFSKQPQHPRIGKYHSHFL